MKQIFLFAFVAIAFFSCTKSENENGDDLIIQGDAIVNAQVTHHYVPLAGAKVWIKKGATTFPGVDTSVYDSYKITDASGYVQFTKLANGPYYFYARGYDPNFLAYAWGYIPFNIDNKPGETKEYDVNIPVSE